MGIDNLLGLGTIVFFGVVVLVGLYLAIFKAVPAPENPPEYTLVNEV